MHHDSPIILDSVSFGYNQDYPILKNINLEIPRGKVVAIMGSSGCGKTTILRLISGQYQATSGKVTLFNHDLAKTSQRQLLSLRKRLGLLFQFGALFTDMTVFDNVAFPLHEHTKLPNTLVKKIVAMKLKSVGLFGTEELFPSELSGGMARRVALARATVLDPELMLYDEPFTGLDPISLNVSAMLIKQFCVTLNQTVVLVTHDIETTFKIADYIYFIENGRVLANGTPDAIKSSNDSTVLQFVNGQIDGPFHYEFDTKLNYNDYIGNKLSWQ